MPEMVVKQQTRWDISMSIHSARKAVIYAPTKTAMQSGKAKTKQWILEFEQDAGAREVDHLMGWTGSDDTLQQLRMKFPSLETAISYAKKEGVTYKVVTPQDKKLHIRAYADNFTKPIYNPLPKKSEG